jgi:hypothetical protein
MTTAEIVRYWFKCHVWMWVPWQWFKCPACDGEGGETDYIDWETGGPWEECGICNGTGRTGIKMLFLWWWWEHKSARVRCVPVKGEKR